MSYENLHNKNLADKAVNLPSEFASKYEVKPGTSRRHVLGRSDAYKNLGIAGKEIDLNSISAEMAEKLAGLDDFPYLKKKATAASSTK